jgi:hypothetical protein
LKQAQWDILTQEERDQYESQQRQRFMAKPKHWWDSYEKIVWVRRYRVAYAITTIATFVGIGLAIWFIERYMLQIFQKGTNIPAEYLVII